MSRRRIVELRRSIARVVQRHVRMSIPLEKVLFGAQGGGRTAAQWAEDCGDLMLPSLPIAEWPHVLLLRDFDDIGERVFDDDRFFACGYFQNARRCVDLYGQFTWCRTDEEIREAARFFVRRYAERTWSEGSGGRTTTKQGHPVVVRRVRASDCYQACDGHHRLSAAYAAGERMIRGHINPWPIVYTPVQELLLTVARHGGRRRCYQPVDRCAEVGSWRVAADWDGRLAAVLEALNERCRDRTIRYFDVAAGLGWMIAKLRERGIDAVGAEADPAACRVGWNVHGLAPETLRHRDAVPPLSERFDVVGCLDADWVARNLVSDAERRFRDLDTAATDVLLVISGSEATTRSLAAAIPRWTRFESVRALPLARETNAKLLVCSSPNI